MTDPGVEFVAIGSGKPWFKWVALGKNLLGYFYSAHHSFSAGFQINEKDRLTFDSHMEFTHKVRLF